MADIVIIGGHGKVALLAAPLLVADGHTVTSLIRDPRQVTDVEATGATALVLDVEKATQAELAEAFEGKDAVVWSAGAGGGDPARTVAVDRDAAIRSMDAAQAAGVQRYVMVSYLGASLDHGIPEDNDFHAYAQSKAVADEYLRTSPLRWTILGPGRLTLEEPTGKITLDPQVSREGGDEFTAERDTSRANVAETIRAALADDATVHRQLEYVDGETPIAEAFAAQ